MYLKNIEIQGFKSFARKIVFEFPPGITGIVGPNGSGKSNVADAVRWVLGEQKIKQLRGTKMEDVIFAGTENRNPQAFAFVSITLDNSDHKLKLEFDEVTVSRRIYRSGESEYRINGSACRLRDVQELFYDTGIGKEGYSIIGQGQIDKILQGKPEERRELFDEAAGIVKYKKRKTITLRKLENERLNLTRVNDVLNELSRREGPLKRQSETATRFVRLREDLKKNDINLFLVENGDLRTKIKDLKTKEEIAAGQLEDSRAEAEGMKEQYEQLSRDLLEMDRKIESLRNAISRGNIVKENLRGQVNVLNEQIHSAGEVMDRYQKRSEEIFTQIEQAKNEKQQLEQEQAANKKALSEASEGSEQQDEAVLKLQNTLEEGRLAIVANKEKLVELVNLHGEINGKIKRLQALSEQMGERRKELEESLSRYHSDQSSQAEKIAHLEAEYKEAQDAVEQGQSDVLSKEEASKAKKQEGEAFAKEQSSLHEEEIRSRSQLEAVRNMTERYEGYGSSIREVMKLKKTSAGIYGVVADIVKTDRKYETAIETALGGSIQNIVTDTETTAKDAIEYLKKNKLGRATFLPLKAVSSRGEFRYPQVLEENGVIGLANSLVDYEPRYKVIADYLLGRIVVCDTIDHALKLARKYSYALKIVTLEGELLNPGGSLTGGAFRNKSNLLGRRREIDDLEKKIQSLQSRQEDLEKKREVLAKERGELNDELALLRTKLQEDRIYLNTVEINLKQANDRRDEIEESFANITNESRSIEEQAGSLSDDSELLLQQLAANEQESENVRERIRQLDEQQSTLKAEEAEELIRRQNLKVEKSTLIERDSALTNSLIRLENDISRLEEELSQLKGSNDSAVKNREKKLGEVEEIKHSIEMAEKEEADLTGQLRELEAGKGAQSGEHREFIERREECTNRIAALDKEVYRLAQSREKLEERFETKTNYIWEEYELTYNSALELRDPDFSDAKAMRAAIASIRSEIRSLGSINVSAIEEYKEVKERLDFLRTQHDDLEKAEADLVRIIKDLDREMRKQFRSEFKKIQSEFGKVFREMFGGGHGYIELEEDVDVLDAGITIIAQPPGKKLQNMMQLSGGEKALTAIAVLFAIQNLKPSPFCILDEIEAALDDANITRFAKYLHKLAGNVQFIVITHRKGTMEAADRLYGITMQEKGVSALISVKLEDFKDEPA